MRKRLLFIAPLAIAGFAAFLAIGGLVVRELWNWLMPAMFAGARTITFWQALGILALSRILIGGFGCHGGKRRHMSWEDRERFRHGMRSRFGGDPPASGVSV